MVGRLKSQHISPKRGSSSFSKKTSNTSKNKESLSNINQKQQNKQKREDFVDLSEQAKQVLDLLKNAKNVSQELQLQNIDHVLSLRLMNLATGLRYLLQEKEDGLYKSAIWNIKDFGIMSLDIIDSVSVETVKLGYSSAVPFYIEASSFRFASRLDCEGYDLTGFSCDLFIPPPDYSQSEDGPLDSCKAWFCSLPPYAHRVTSLASDHKHLSHLLHSVFFDVEIEMKEDQQENILYLLAKATVFDSSQPLSPLTLVGITFKMSPGSNRDQISLTL